MSRAQPPLQAPPRPRAEAPPPQVLFLRLEAGGGGVAPGPGADERRPGAAAAAPTAAPGAERRYGAEGRRPGRADERRYGADERRPCARRAPGAEERRPSPRCGYGADERRPSPRCAARVVRAASARGAAVGAALFERGEAWLAQKRWREEELRREALQREVPARAGGSALNLDASTLQWNRPGTSTRSVAGDATEPLTADRDRAGG